MRRATVFATTLMLVVFALPLAATAARIDAAAFAADCNDDSSVTVSGNLWVVGGVGSIDTDCLVTIADGSRLLIRDATLTCGVPCSLVVGNSGESSVIKVVSSIINVTGPLQLSAGCCSGGELPESGGLVKVVESALTGSSVEVSASLATNDGKVDVRRSKLTATGPLGVALFTSSNGVTLATDNTINSAGDIDIYSGFGDPGVTKAKGNEFNAFGAVTITANGGRCVSSGNTPPVACT